MSEKEGKNIFLIHGNDDFLVAKNAREVINSIVPPKDQLTCLEVINGNVTTVDDVASVLNNFKEGIQTTSLFGDRKVVWLEAASFLSDSGVGRHESTRKLVNDFAEFLKGGLHAGPVAVVTTPKADKRFAFYKACSSVGQVMEFSIPEKTYQSESQARDHASEEFRKSGLKVSGEALELFLEKVGTDTGDIVKEIEKLSVYAGKSGEVGIREIDDIVCDSRETKSWDLADAVGSRDLKRALQVLRRLLFQDESPIGLICGLEARFRELLLYREALDAKWIVENRGFRGGGYEWGAVPPAADRMLKEEFEKDPRGTNPYRVGILAKQAMQFSGLTEIRKCLSTVVATHEKLVSSKVEQPILLELMLVRMLS